MLPAERRAKLIRLLAHIDQELAAADDMASDKELSRRDRKTATRWLYFHKQTLQRVERLLGTDGSLTNGGPQS